VTDRVCMACNAWFCYLLLCIPCANCAKRKITNSKAANIHNNNAVGCKRNENAVVLVGIGRLNFLFLMVNKSVTAKVRKVVIEHAVSLWRSNC